MYHWKNILFVSTILFGWMAGASVYAQLSEADEELLEVVADESLDSGEICDLAFGLILVDGANVNAQRESDGFTALHIAAERGFDLLAMGLVRAGARVGTENGEGHTARQLAEAAGQAEILALFTDMENPDEQRRYDVFNLADRALFEAIVNDDLTDDEICDLAFGLILVDDANVNAIDPATGNTPLHAAARVGNLLLARGLVQLGADVNRRNTPGLSPVDIAIILGHVEMAVVLADELGADLTGRDFHGMTPLHVAAEFGRREIVTPLMLAGAPLEIQDYQGRTPLYYAARRGYWDMAQALVNAGAGVYTVNLEARGGTPLHVAVQQGNLNVAAYFIALGTDMTAVDAQGFTAYRRAQFADLNDFVQLFEEWGYLADMGIARLDGDSEDEPSFSEENIQACMELLADDAAQEEDRRLNSRRSRAQEAATGVRRTGPREAVGVGNLDCLTHEMDREPATR